MQGERSWETLVNELLKEGHTEIANGFVSFKAGNQFNGHLSSFNHNHKIQNKNTNNIKQS